VYALGCIAHVLLTGTPPFQGKDHADWQKQHISADAKPLPEELPGKLRSLISLMLRKEPGVRPSPERIISTLNAIKGEVAKGGVKHAALSSIDAAISREN